VVVVVVIVVVVAIVVVVLVRYGDLCCVRLRADEGRRHSITLESPEEVSYRTDWVRFLGPIILDDRQRYHDSTFSQSALHLNSPRGDG